jgi:hypothetical protein
VERGEMHFFLAKKGIEMTGFDFSSYAISIAKKRAAQGEFPKPSFLIVHDAMTKWPFPKNFFDIGIDNFGSSDYRKRAWQTFCDKRIFASIKTERVFICVCTIN